MTSMLKEKMCIFGFGISIHYNEDFDTFFRKVISDTKSKEIDRLRKNENS
jgi:hypothetical protein